MAVGPFTVSEDRAKVVSFTTPFMEDKAGIVVHRPETSQTSQFQVMRPFAYKVWVAVTAAMFIVGTLLYLVDRLNSWICKGRGETQESMTFLTYMWNVFGFYLEQSEYSEFVDRGISVVV